MENDKESEWVINLLVLLVESYVEWWIYDSSFDGKFGGFILEVFPVDYVVFGAICLEVWVWKFL